MSVILFDDAVSLILAIVVYPWNLSNRETSHQKLQLHLISCQFNNTFNLPGAGFAPYDFYQLLHFMRQLYVHNLIFPIPIVLNQPSRILCPFMNIITLEIHIDTDYLEGPFQTMVQKQLSLLTHLRELSIIISEDKPCQMIGMVGWLWEAGMCSIRLLRVKDTRTLHDMVRISSSIQMFVESHHNQFLWDVLSQDHPWDLNW